MLGLNGTPPKEKSVEESSIQKITKTMEIIPNLSNALLPTALATGLAGGTLGFLLFFGITRKPEGKPTIPIKSVPGFLLLGLLGGILLPINPAALWNNITLVALLAILLAASWEDIKNQIAPNSLTLGGAALLAGLSLLQWTQSLESSLHPSSILLGAISASAIMAGISLFGKIVFGRKVTEFEPPEELEFLPESKSIRIGEETLQTELLFQEGSGKAEFFSPEGNRVATLLENGKTTPETLEKGQKINRFTTPRDVLGRGDIKFMLGVGAVCGVTGSIFAITVGCALGAILAFPLALRNCRIPLIPFLSTGCIIYLWQGKQILNLMGW